MQPITITTMSMTTINKCWKTTTTKTTHLIAYVTVVAIVVAI